MGKLQTLHSRSGALLSATCGLAAVTRLVRPLAFIRDTSSELPILARASGAVAGRSRHHQSGCLPAPDRETTVLL
jgi:hypothetical protein